MAVYFIRSGNYVKIGKSDNPWKRLATLQTGNPATLEMLAIAPGGVDFEAGLQETFGSDCERGEWYKPTERLMAFVASIRATFPHLQNPPQVNLHQPPIGKMSADEEIPTSADDPVMAMGESLTFRLSHKGLFRHPRDLRYLKEAMTLYYGGYWVARNSDEWLVLSAPGLSFRFENEQYFSVSRVGEVNDSPANYMKKAHSLDGAMNFALKHAIYNRKNTAPWLGIYNDDGGGGIVIAVKHEPLATGHVRLDVPEEVMAYWRQYQYKSPLPEGVSIEA